MRRRRKTQAAPVEAPAPLPVARSRRGLVRFLSERVATKRVVSVLGHPAAAPVLAVAVGALFVAVAVGALVGAALAFTASRGEW